MCAEILKRNPLQGIGVGLRTCHYHHILNDRPPVSWFEVLSDNYLVAGGPPLAYLEAIAAHYPVAMHGVGMSLGSTDPLNDEYLKKLKRLADRIKPALISDHLCWTSVKGHYFHDLLPLPFTEEAIKHVAARIRQVQAFLDSRILIENVSSYLEYHVNAMPEWEFLNAVAKEANCWILLDVNNVYVSASNHHYDPVDYIRNVDANRVKQYHLAGFTNKGKYLFDTHSEAVHEPVWLLYQETIERVGRRPTLIEWDGEIPPFIELLKQANRAQEIMDAAHVA